MPKQPDVVRTMTLPSGFHISTIDDDNCSITYLTIFDLEHISAQANTSSISTSATNGGGGGIDYMSQVTAYAASRMQSLGLLAEIAAKS